ncbi:MULTISPECIES: hypothetical protein [Paraburkholderia]|uniref:hypothetical protein n=1 Tax=Paraburkholderia TaxID=1822464 RepID=UPI00190CD2B8|nr:hypothetical protein [Paraburkholderia nemoris]MBK3737739.1 hypothetical protein [Paraburkholderia aspalathi]CAE6695873.1 hypothetical protein R69619_00476 [Paraburkholderia nemoris]
MKSAIFGLVGVIIGAILTATLTVVRELWFQRRKDAKDREYLAVQVSGQLERYVAECMEVARDYGLYQGQRNALNECEAQAEEPKFEPELLKVEWKSLPVDLMYEILDFPIRAEEAKRHSDSAYEHAFPPDYEDWFVERQYQYAKLGLAASSLAARLRDNVGLPPRPAPDKYFNPLEFMANRVLQVEQQRKTWEREAMLGHTAPTISPTPGNADSHPRPADS